jgi:hypothetical protein
MSQILVFFFSSGGVNGTSGGASLLMIVSFMSTSAFFEMGVGMCWMPAKVATSQGEKQDKLLKNSLIFVQKKTTGKIQISNSVIGTSFIISSSE